MLVFLFFSFLVAVIRCEVFIRITRPVSAGVANNIHHLHFREFEVYDAANNLLTLKIEDFDSEEPGFEATKSIDGDFTALWHTFFSPEDTTKDHFIKYRIQNCPDFNIARLVLYNRKNAGLAINNRVIGVFIEIIETGVGVIQTFTINTFQEEYTFYFTGSFTGVGCAPGYYCYYYYYTCYPIPVRGGGDPEYDSLDGLALTYDGPCQYTLSTNDCVDKTNDGDDASVFFSVMARHGRARNREKQVVSITDVLMTIDETDIIVSRGNVVTIDGLLLEEPTYSNVGISVTKNNFKNKKSEMEEVVRIDTYFGLIVSVVLGGNIATVRMVVADNIHACGLLGNNNGDTKDDIQLKNGTILFDVSSQENINLMGDSWMVPYNQQPLQCILHPLDSETTKKNCYLFEYEKVKHFCNKMVDLNLKSMTGKDINACFSMSNETYVDTTRIFDDCITEMCNCNSPDTQQSCYPKYALGLWNDACRNVGVEFIPRNLSLILPYN